MLNAYIVMHDYGRRHFRDFNASTGSRQPSTSLIRSEKHSQNEQHSRNWGLTKKMSACKDKDDMLQWVSQRAPECKPSRCTPTLSPRQ